MKNFLITLIIILIPVKSFGLIEVDITRGNLNPLPIAVSPLSIDEESRKNFENILKKKNIGSEISSICLLYTSPSPRDGLLSRMPSSA